MNTKSLIPGPEELHKEWSPVLELATREVFETMLASKLEASPTAPTDPLHVTAMVGLAGMLCGLVTVRCDERAAALMASKMLGIEVDKVGPEVSDALGEVCNMVAGNFKNKIAGLGDGCMLSPPSVITGGDYTVHADPDSPQIQVNFLFERLPIVISINIRS